ncbi:MAG: flagellar biosynthesis protein FlaG [Caulobacteraceae bacterium]|nr:MAG: flagellar biosynthesis protein FlaG [Caulobacteraceae bacterium]
MDAAHKLTPAAPIAEIANASPSNGDFRDTSGDQSEKAPVYRLVIEEGPTKGSFIYKTLDRVTGEVIRQLPREKLIEMITSDEYASGSVINTRA